MIDFGGQTHSEAEVERLAERAKHIPQFEKCDHRLHTRALAEPTESATMLFWSFPCGCVFGISKSAIRKLGLVDPTTPL